MSDSAHPLSSGSAPGSAGNGAGPILLTGATGYVGGRLLSALQRSGRSVRCLSRRPEALRSRVGATTTVVAGDVLDAASLEPAFVGIEAAYYLVHSMGSGESFERLDREGAANFAAAARNAGVSRIVYLGGLGSDEALSAHLASRQEVGEILRTSGVSTIELRASIVIGSGSASFEIVRSLVERLPALTVPRSVETQSQPIAVEDLIDYLLVALELDGATSSIFEIGGADQVTYAGLMREYARQRRLHRRLIPVPLMTPWICGVGIGLLTPVYRSIGAALVESLRHETVIRDDAALAAFPVRPRGFVEAIERALVAEDNEFAETRWSDAISAREPRSWGGVAFGRRRIASRALNVAAESAQAFAPIQRIGGATGWYYADWFWRIRGRIDALRGGVGLRRGRRDAVALAAGDTLDFWRVERFEADRLLSLQAEMLVPGRLWLQFEVDAHPQGATVRQTAMFDPAGLVGLIYWYALYPIHRRIFRGMLNAIGQQIVTGTNGVHSGHQGGSSGRRHRTAPRSRGAARSSAPR
jgi:uncharacterized protein YbjT (DUF2867 family)